MSGPNGRNRLSLFINNMSSLKNLHRLALMFTNQCHFCTQSTNSSTVFVMEMPYKSHLKYVGLRLTKLNIIFIKKIIKLLVIRNILIKSYTIVFCIFSKYCKDVNFFQIDHRINVLQIKI